MRFEDRRTPQSLLKNIYGYILTVIRKRSEIAITSADISLLRE